MLQLSRVAIVSALADGSEIISSSQRRPRAIDATSVARVSERMGRVFWPLDDSGPTGSRIPVYVRAGAIIPLGPAMQYSAEKPVDPLSVHVYGFAAEDLGSEARTSAFSLYEDDGISRAYEQGQFERTALRLRQTRNSVRFEVRSVSGDGNYRSVARRGYQLHFHGFQSPVARILLNRREIARASSREEANWTTGDSSGDFVIAIPPSTDRTFELEIAAEDKGR